MGGNSYANDEHLNVNIVSYFAAGQNIRKGVKESYCEELQYFPESHGGTKD